MMIIFIKIQHPVITGNRNKRQKRGHIKLNFQLSFVTVGVSFISSSLNEPSLAITPSLIQHIYSAIIPECVGSPRVYPVFGLISRWE
ncbi:hypothetical protein HanXRQr2_Chr06g0265501 [Helianthus annuus]|uniref:Uncharacterized protein n=1 Tax=Helianthus annuus TaxID=4232 RepID=A0A9K3NJJ6_HELAN|nr:hypothetical protein HanXRQr2_Chr06g0265501 [Helianthus annuus]